MMRNSLPTVLFSLLLLAGLPAKGQDVVGQVSFANSGSAAAQAPFLHGLAQLHNFEYASAASDFRQAEAADPGFALAYWGEAMTYDHPVWNQQDRTAALAALSRLGPTREARLAKAPTSREKDYLLSVETLYGDGSKVERDLQYADAMSQIHARYPEDVDAAAFYALALMGTTQGVRNERIYMQAAALLLPLFYKYPNHPGVAHYLIHSCDDPIHAGLALPAARSYSQIASNAPHALHMTSHIFIALGLWPDVVRANRQAIETAARHRTAAGEPPNRCGHYQYWLEYGLLEMGQKEEAKRVVDSCRQEASEAGNAVRAIHVVDPDDSSISSFVEMQTRYVVDTADWNGEVAKWTVGLGTGPLINFNHAFFEGFAAAERGDVARARKALAAMNAVVPHLIALFDKGGIAPNDPKRRVLEIQTLQLEAITLAAEGDLSRAVTLAAKASELEESMPFAFGPPDPIKPSYELLGEMLLTSHQPKEATAAFYQAVLRAPGRTQSTDHAAHSDIVSPQ
jgi:hypothetical protein